MFGNYLKISLAVLLRRKFLTFVNLFGATLTLTVLVVAYALFDSVVSPAGAQHRQDQMLLITRLSLSNTRLENRWSSYLGQAFFERYIATLETPDKVSYATMPNEATSYLDGRKITSQMRRTDAEYWELLDFDVIDGRVLSADDMQLGRYVAVINEATADEYFPGTAAVGESITVGPESFEVVGVVADEPETSLLAYADIWVPVTTAPAQRNSWIGDGIAMLWFENPGRMELAREEYLAAVAQFEPIDEPAELDKASSFAATSFELFAREMLESYFDDENGAIDFVPRFLAIAVVLVLLFMALPAINMANLNVGRILERAPEIGLRKAAGASTRTLIGQFVFENVVLSLLGGVLAFALAPVVLGLLNDTVFTYGRLSLNFSVLIAGLVFVLVFGVISGIYPAWKMARLQPAACLRGLQHA